MQCLYIVFTHRLKNVNKFLQKSLYKLLNLMKSYKNASFLAPNRPAIMRHIKLHRLRSP
jgi:UDP-N-acetylglucosamine 2-epimerase